MRDERATSPVSREDYQDCEFILADLQHSLELSPAEQISRFYADPWSAFSGLQGPNGSDLPLSREAQNRFVGMATRGFEKLGASAQRHRLEKIVEAMKAEMSALLLRGLVPGPEDAHELFNAAVRQVEHGYIELTYHIPCSVVAERNYPSFAIGPVTFLLRDQFFQENEIPIDRAVEDAGLPQIKQKLSARVESFYSDFQWIASITVPPCDAEISRQRARMGVQKALDVFKLVVGGERLSR
jgi:hypothetical protein